MQQIYDVLILGAGAAGYTAAMYASRAGLSVLVLEKQSVGGQMVTTDIVDNYPGFPEGISGFDLSMQMQRGAERYGAKTEYTEIRSVSLTDAYKTLTTDAGIFKGRTAIIATGAAPRELEIDGERELAGKGVHYCAHCDGRFYKDKTVLVVGGGNSAASDALYLSKLCKKVILVHRRDSLRATKIYEKALLKADNVEIMYRSRVVSFVRTDKLQGVRVQNVATEQVQEVSVDGVFVGIGRKPETKLFTGQILLDEYGYIVADESTKTNIPGVFAAGDVRTKPLRQIVTAAADGAVAAQMAEEYLT